MRMAGLSPSRCPANLAFRVDYFEENVISVLQLGLIDYATASQLQQRLVSLRKENTIGDVLLLLEHAPVITLGRNAKPANLLAAPDQLAGKGVELFECDRGGDVTFHGPGQLVAYPIFDLRSLPSGDPNRKSMGAVEFVRCLEEVLIQTCTEFSIACGRIPGLTGVWTRHAAPAKIAAIGVHISRGVTSHGLALNVNTDLSYFQLIVPCGISSRPVTSMKQELGRSMPLTAVAETVARKFGEVFHADTVELPSLDDLLKTKLDIPLQVPSEFQSMHKEDETFWA
jgi:lipoyl(octanoyl) transferase